MEKTFKYFEKTKKFDIIYIVVGRAVKRAKVIDSFYNPKTQNQVVISEEYLGPNKYGRKFMFRAYPKDSMWNNNAFIAFTTQEEAVMYVQSKK